MIIGIDIDGVLTDDNTYRLDCMSKYCYENNLSVFDYPYAYEDKCKWSDEILENYRKQYFFDYIKNIPARRFASEVIKKLHEEGHKIIIITGRYKTQEDSDIGKQMREDTINWLNKNNIIYDDICFTFSPKTSAIREKKVDIMIDDSPRVIPEVAKIVKAFCFDNSYNINLDLPNMTRVFSWYDIYRKINEMSYM